jgi:hypothetical protein
MRILTAVIICSIFSGCSHIYLMRTTSIEACAKRTSIEITKGLEESYMGMSILVSTPVDAVTLSSSDFGLALQELLIGAMAEEKANIVDIQLRKEPYLSCEHGLISLSRDAGKVRQDSRADIILVSTYMAGKEEIVVTTRAIDFMTNDVITSATTTLERTAQIDKLLRNRDQARLYER